jgi:hypothetical protein
LLAAFQDYAAAAHAAEELNLPYDAWRFWGYRRATLARVLASDGMMRQVAYSYDEALKKYAPPPPTMVKRLRLWLNNL